MGTIFFITGSKSYETEEEAQEDLKLLMEECDLSSDAFVVAEMETFDS